MVGTLAVALDVEANRAVVERVLLGVYLPGAEVAVSREACGDAPLEITVSYRGGTRALQITRPIAEEADLVSLIAINYGSLVAQEAVSRAAYQGESINLV